MAKRYVLGALAGLIALPATAEVKLVTPAGFEVVDSVSIKAKPERVFAAIGEIGHWWDPVHSYSHDASNMTIELKAGGCFCEKLPNGGSVQHMSVVYAAPDQAVRLSGGLGPLQAEAVDGTLTWTIKPDAGGVTLSQDYVVGGFIRDGMAKWAPPVDGVLHSQLVRLKRYIETGSPAEATK